MNGYRFRSGQPVREVRNHLRHKLFDKKSTDILKIKLRLPVPAERTQQAQFLREMMQLQPCFVNSSKQRQERNDLIVFRSSLKKFPDQLIVDDRPLDPEIGQAERPAERIAFVVVRVEEKPGYPLFHRKTPGCCILEQLVAQTTLEFHFQKKAHRWRSHRSRRTKMLLI